VTKGMPIFSIKGRPLIRGKPVSMKGTPVTRGKPVVMKWPREGNCDNSETEERRLLGEGEVKSIVGQFEL